MPPTLKITQNHGTVINVRGFYTCALDATTESTIAEKRNQNPPKSTNNKHSVLIFVWKKLQHLIEFGRQNVSPCSPKSETTRKKKYTTRKNAKNANSIEIGRHRP